LTGRVGACVGFLQPVCDIARNNEIENMHITSQQRAILVECLSARVTGLVGKAQGADDRALFDFQKERDSIEQMIGELSEPDGALRWP
jgi:hypothetical protein